MSPEPIRSTQATSDLTDSPSPIGRTEHEPGSNAHPGTIGPPGRNGFSSRLSRRMDRIPRRVRRVIPLGVVILAAAIQILLWWANSGDATRQVMSSWYIFPTTAFLLVLWWLFLSGYAWSSRLIGVGVLGACTVLFFSVVRVKEFSGDMVPRFEYRWQQSAEQRADEYFKNQRNAGVSGQQLAADLAVAADDWPQFEGPNRDGIARGVHLRTDWNEHPPRLVWRHPVGAAWSSFAVVGSYAFTQEQRGKDEAVVCYDADTGKQIWVHLDRKIRFTRELAGVGPRATPTVFGSRVYAFGSSGILNCFEPRTGKCVWSTNTVETAGVEPVQFGMSGSPLVYGDLVVVNPGGPRQAMKGKRTSGRALIAYNRHDGKQVWTAGDYQAAYASPILATIGGVRQVVIFDGLGAAGHDSETGKQLWRSEEWTNEFHNNIAQPIVLPSGSVFLSSGYGKGCLLFDVSKSGSQWTTTRRWTAPNQFKLKFNSGVLRDRFVYGLDEGILACFDLSQGKEVWKRRRYKYGQLILVDDNLLVISEDGDAILVDASPSGAREIAKFHAIDGKTWNYPAISRGRLYVRNGEVAACYDLMPTQSAVAESTRVQ